jgi:hypothetical protein
MQIRIKRAPAFGPAQAAVLADDALQARIDRTARLKAELARRAPGPRSHNIVGVPEFDPTSVNFDTVEAAHREWHQRKATVVREQCRDLLPQPARPVLSFKD